MRRAWRGMFVAGSFVLLLITVAAMVRSYRVEERIVRIIATDEPLSRSAERYAASHGIAADYVADQVTWSVALARGRVILGNDQTKEPMSRSSSGGGVGAEEQSIARASWGYERGELGVREWQYSGWLGQLGFASAEQSSSTRLYAVSRAVTVPLWPLVLLAAVAPLVWLRRVTRRWYRGVRGRCIECGYDLRAQPEGRRCPECGALPDPAEMADDDQHALSRPIPAPSSQRPRRGILAGMSLVIFAIVVAASVRSIFVQDAYRWSKMTEEPMTSEAREWARQRSFAGNFIALYRHRSVALLRGIVTIRRYETQTVMSRWDTNYVQYVGRVNRERAVTPAGDTTRGFAPGGPLAWLGFGVRSASVGSVQWKGSEQEVLIPLWPIALLTAIWPIVWLRRFRRYRHRVRGGLCLSCGYDLRGRSGGAGGRCPECGALPEHAEWPKYHDQPLPARTAAASARSLPLRHALRTADPMRGGGYNPEQVKSH